MNQVHSPEQLDDLKHPERIFHSLLAQKDLPAEKRAFVEKAQEKFKRADLSRNVYWKCLDMGFVFGILPDLRDALQGIRQGNRLCKHGWFPQFGCPECFKAQPGNPERPGPFTAKDIEPFSGGE